MASDAWTLAHRAASRAGVELRALTTVEDADRILEVMVATWGEHQLVPREMIRALADSGNVPFGAFAGNRMIGYVLGWTGSDREDGLHVHSHMLAAVPDRRHQGVGYALKLAQRAQALELGAHVARWTFDPLVARNAYFNLQKLGVVADRFERHFYGEMADVVNRGDRTDRFVARWDLDREPGPHEVPAEATPMLSAEGDPPRPGPLRPVRGAAASVQVPPDHPELRVRDPGIGAAWRDASARAIEWCLDHGMVAAAFDRERCAYVFVARNEVGA
ncbi:MAG TPA: GNAT family N-acetyltransferase [Actinomycetota bacterium]